MSMNESDLLKVMTDLFVAKSNSYDKLLIGYKELEERYRSERLDYNDQMDHIEALEERIEELEKELGDE